jgi:hypothetical protein
MPTLASQQFLQHHLLALRFRHRWQHSLIPENLHGGWVESGLKTQLTAQSYPGNLYGWWVGAGVPGQTQVTQPSGSTTSWVQQQVMNMTTAESQKLSLMHLVRKGNWARLSLRKPPPLNKHPGSKIEATSFCVTQWTYFSLFYYEAQMNQVCEN